MSDIADAAGVRATRSKPAWAVRDVISEALQEVAAGRRGLHAGAIAGAIERGGQAARAARAVRILASAAAPILARARLAVGIERAGATRAAAAAHTAAVGVGLILIPHQIVAARAGASCVAADRRDAICAAAAAVAGAAARARATTVEARLGAIFFAILTGGGCAALRRRGTR